MGIPWGIRWMRNKATLGKATAGLIALLLLAAVLQGGCGGSFFSIAGSSSTDNGGGGSSGGGGAAGGVGFAYVTNFDGNISELKISSANGALSLIGTISGGPADGPVGIAAHPSNNFLYVVNFADDLVHEYNINTTTGQLAVLGTVSTGAGGGPSGIAVTPSGSFAYVTNQSSGSVAQYSIASNGTLTLIGTLSGLNTPQGVAANGSNVFVAESGAGTVDSFSIGTTGLLTLVGNTPVEGVTSGTPSQVLLNPSQGTLYASDFANGAVAVFTIETGGVLSFDGASSTGTTSDAPIGLALSGNNFYSANSSADTITEYGLQNVTLPAVTGTVTGLNEPTGIAVNSGGDLVYVTNQGDGTVDAFSVSDSNDLLDFISSVNTESNGNTGSTPKFIVLVP
jgi:DNA-binding beta-propeller fold protein YncE